MSESTSVLVLASADNALTQRTTLALRRAGHQVRVALVNTEADIVLAADLADFTVIVAPFLKTRVPAEVHQRHTVLIAHPGPPHDRGPSSLDYAITEDEPLWGVTVFRATDEFDAGDVYAWRTFTMPERARKSAIYNGPVAEAAVACLLEAVAKSMDPAFVPTPQDQLARPVASARTRPALGQRERAFDWNASVETIVRAVHAADGSPGVLAPVADRAIYLFDAHPGLTRATGEEPGTVLSRMHHAVEIACGTGTVWIGHMRPKPTVHGQRTHKAPAATVLARAGMSLPAAPGAWGRTFTDLRYDRYGSTGVLEWDTYNGAMDTDFCRRLLGALRFALSQDTRVLLLRNRGAHFSNGIHLGQIQASAQPTKEAWANIRAINAVCRVLLESTPAQVVVAAVGANAGAGGAMLAMCADVVTAAESVVWNPHYQSMGLPGSEFHTYTLPRRVGEVTARRLLSECAPIDTLTARELGMCEDIGPAHRFDEHALELAARYTEERLWRYTMSPKWDRLNRAATGKPLDAYETEELGNMSIAIFDDRWGFADKRAQFLFAAPEPTPVARPLRIRRAS